MIIGIILDGWPNSNALDDNGNQYNPNNNEPQVINLPDGNNGELLVSINLENSVWVFNHHRSKYRNSDNNILKTFTFSFELNYGKIRYSRNWLWNWMWKQTHSSLFNDLKYVLPNSVNNSSVIYKLGIPNNVTIINTNCFNSCSNLTAIVFGTGLTEIANNCFNNCSKLRSVTYKSSSIPIIAQNTFINASCGNRELYLQNLTSCPITTTTLPTTTTRATTTTLPTTTTRATTTTLPTTTTRATTTTLPTTTTRATTTTLPTTTTRATTTTLPTTTTRATTTTYTNYYNKSHDNNLTNYYNKSHNYNQAYYYNCERF